MSESPTQQLADEHEYVKMVVGAMDREVAYIERTGRVHAERVAQMIDFTRNFTSFPSRKTSSVRAWPFSKFTDPLLWVTFWPSL